MPFEIWVTTGESHPIKMPSSPSSLSIFSSLRKNFPGKFLKISPTDQRLWFSVPTRMKKSGIFAASVAAASATAISGPSSSGFFCNSKIHLSREVRIRPKYLLSLLSLSLSFWKLASGFFEFSLIVFSVRLPRKRKLTDGISRSDEGNPQFSAQYLHPCVFYFLLIFCITKQVFSDSKRKDYLFVNKPSFFRFH